MKVEVLTTPGVVINEKLEFTGIPKYDELEKKISE